MANNVITDDFGDEMVHVVERTRPTVARISQRNDAYLIQWSGPHTEYSTPEEMFDAAGSLRRAKRVARGGAAAFGYIGPFRWEADTGLDDGGYDTVVWTLVATHVSEYDRYVD